jgi:hypothetical protein
MLLKTTAPDQTTGTWHEWALLTLASWCAVALVLGMLNSLGSTLPTFTATLLATGLPALVALYLLGHLSHLSGWAYGVTLTLVVAVVNWLLVDMVHWTAQPWPLLLACVLGVALGMVAYNYLLPTPPVVARAGAR